MRRLSLLAGTTLAVSLLAAPVAAGGPPSVGFYVDGNLYRTIGTPTDITAQELRMEAFFPSDAATHQAWMRKMA